MSTYWTILDIDISKYTRRFSCKEQWQLVEGEIPHWSTKSDNSIWCKNIGQAKYPVSSTETISIFLHLRNWIVDHSDQYFNAILTYTNYTYIYLIRLSSKRCYSRDRDKGFKVFIFCIDLSFQSNIALINF